jgi:cell division protein ZapE
MWQVRAGVRDIRSRRLARVLRLGEVRNERAGIFAPMTQNVTGPVTGRLRAQIAQAELDADLAQIDVARRLDDLAARLQHWQPQRNGLRALLGRSGQSAPRGLYIFGPVGRGKTMLADLFFELAPFAPKLRRHFHEFMADVHERIGRARHAVDGDPIPFVADGIAQEARLLCFDELQVTDIADAMILGRLFTQLFDRGVVVVATSNSAPRALYKDGLNRRLFLPFVDVIEARMDVVELNSAKDYRLDKLAGLPLYFTPADERAKAELDRHWDRLTGRHPGREESVHVKGRCVRVPAASMGIGRFDFKELCELPLGSLDYLHLAHAYHTLIVDRIPVLVRERRDTARRFMTLIDTLYDNGVCLIASAEAEPAGLYPDGTETDAFQRTVSRLMEMRSEAYLKSRHGEGRQLGTLPG